MAHRMGYKATLDWLIDNEDLSDFARNDDDPTPTVACTLAADIFGKTIDRLRIDLIHRSSDRHATRQRYGE